MFLTLMRTSESDSAVFAVADKIAAIKTNGESMPYTSGCVVVGAILALAAGTLLVGPASRKAASRSRSASRWR